MAKTESTLKNMVLTLLVITCVAGASLGFMYELTKGPIAAAKAAKQQAAIKEVVPGFTNNPGDEMYELTSKEGLALKLFPAKKDGELIGVAIETQTNKGFSGNVKVMVGLKPDGTIINYQVLEHKETPGLGTKMADWFKTDKGNQSILGKHPKKNNLTVSKDGGEVDAITAATISSRAFLDAIRVAFDTYTENQSSQPAVTNTSTEEGGAE
ncbi:RnfABCDGE type electron transport complex subunit G [Carboxylicivirga sediminis]|uniref:Ion-translocating oxidoreductase complex subunit G n=1 Tax=Carboxylicivirga sediminis TaxID=2006564 RepID=A0A941F783_9BACT|nr:RnfABCDGE type electron transport complex subunit G [Carboxylicivirga sediminis]MBR8538101.1 RnfABCDGE type electron transport complex subunit G [Carboxylicivirga sediminis]